MSETGILFNFNMRSCHSPNILNKIQQNQNDTIYQITIVLPNNSPSIFIHLKLELLTQFPASNDDFFYIYEKNTSPILNYCIN